MMQRIIDTHLHVLDLERFHLPWLHDYPAINRNFLIEDYIAAWKGRGDYEIEGAIHVELDSAPDFKAKENAYFIECAHDPDNLIQGVVIPANLLDGNAAAYLKPYLPEKAVKGVRHVLHVEASPRGKCLESVFVENTKMLGEMGLIFEGCLRSTELKDFRQLVQQCPNTFFVLNHMGLLDAGALQKPDQKEYIRQWKNDIESIGALPNAACKISGLSIANPEIIGDAVDCCLDAFGEERILFASNYPVCNLSIDIDSWTKAILQITQRRTQKFRDKLFYLNAKRLYSI